MSIASSTLERLPGRAAPAGKAAMLPIVLAGSIGTIIEGCDFLIYGAAAALAFKALFFPNFDPLTETLASDCARYLGREPVRPGIAACTARQMRRRRRWVRRSRQPARG
jgi:hypothetical protein